MPIPPAISSAFDVRCALAVNTPNGPSANTRVPTGISPSLAVWSPRAFTVIRKESPAGTSESENGCFVDQKPLVRNRQKKNWPASAPSRSRPRPPMRSETTSGASCVTAVTRRSLRAACASGRASRKKSTSPRVSANRLRQ